MTSSPALTREFGPSFIIDVATTPEGGPFSLHFGYVAGGVIAVDDTTLAVTHSYQDVPTELGTIEGAPAHPVEDDDSFVIVVNHVDDAAITDWLCEYFFTEATRGQSDEKLADEAYIADLRERIGHLASDIEADLRDKLARSQAPLTSGSPLGDLLAGLLGIDPSGGSLRGSFAFGDGDTTIRFSTTAYW
jgi:hypothetical protein